LSMPCGNEFRRAGGEGRHNPVRILRRAAFA